MPTRAPKRCTTPGCGNQQAVGPTGKCPPHLAEAHADTDARRPTPHQRGYDRTHQRRFRRHVLQRDQTCVICHQAPATEADHHPLDRRELVAQGLDPNDPAHGRGLCKPCHSSSTAKRHGFGTRGVGGNH